MHILVSLMTMVETKPWNHI